MVKLLRGQFLSGMRDNVRCLCWTLRLASPVHDQNILSQQLKQLECLHAACYLPCSTHQANQKVQCMLLAICHDAFV